MSNQINGPIFLSPKMEMVPHKPTTFKSLRNCSGIMYRLPDPCLFCLPLTKMAVAISQMLIKKNLSEWTQSQPGPTSGLGH